MTNTIYKERDTGLFYTPEEVDDMDIQLEWADLCEALYTHLDDEMLQNLYDSLPFELQCKIYQEAKENWIFTHFEELTEE